MFRLRYIQEGMQIVCLPFLFFPYLKKRFTKGMLFKGRSRFTIYIMNNRINRVW